MLPTEEIIELKRQLALVQHHAKHAVDNLASRYSAGFTAGLKQALPYERELLEALDLERKQRIEDNISFTEDILKLEEEIRLLKQSGVNLDYT